MNGPDSMKGSASRSELSLSIVSLNTGLEVAIATLGHDDWQQPP